MLALLNVCMIALIAWRPATATPLAATMLAFAGAVVALSAIRMRGRWRASEERVTHLEASLLSLQASQAHALHLAHYDPATGLPNRVLFNELAEEALECADEGETAAILLLDLDGFRRINDRFGHVAGDALIGEVARRLSTELGPDAVVARLGSDDFAILLTRSSLACGLEDALAHIREEMRRPFTVLGAPVELSASIGAALAPENGNRRAALMRKAERALHRAKHGEGGGRATRDGAQALRGALEADLREAVLTGAGLCVHFQPVIDCSVQKVVGLEALLRWHHATRGWVSPHMFVPVAEHIGLIGQLGESVLAEACKIAAEWPHIAMAVNLSAVQLREPGIAHTFEAIARGAGVEPAQLEFDVDESVLLNPASRAALASLRLVGFRIALDNFGPGRSPLSDMRYREIDKVKIDGSYIRGLGLAAGARAAVAAVVRLGKVMGLEISAECVETPEQERFLREAGCERLQGFLFSRAVPAHQLRSSLGAGRTDVAA